MEQLLANARNDFRYRCLAAICVASAMSCAGTARAAEDPPMDGDEAHSTADTGDGDVGDWILRLFRGREDSDAPPRKDSDDQRNGKSGNSDGAGGNAGGGNAGGGGNGSGGDDGGEGGDDGGEGGDDD
jgi:hypothetical protein